MKLTIIQYILLAIGVGFIIFGIIKKLGYKKMLLSGIRVKGVVTRIEIEFNKNSSKSYYPVIKYQTREQGWVEKKYDIGTIIGGYRTGDEVEVVYDPDKNDDFIIDDSDTRLLGPAFMGLGIAVIIGVLAYQFVIAGLLK